MTPATAVMLALEGAPIACTREEFPGIRAALAEARDLRAVFSPSEEIDTRLTVAINTLQREHLR